MLALVLLPGMMCDGRLFAGQIAAFSGRRVVQLAPINAHDSVAALADAVLANAPPQFALAGLSMGGIVAMEVVRRAPDRVARLALMDTNHRAERPDVAARRGPQIKAAQNGQLRAVMRDEMKPNYLSDGPQRAEILDTCMAMAEALGPNSFVRQSQALRDRPDQTETLREVNCPTLILCGAEDSLCPPARHREMAALVPRSKLTIINDAGHLPTLEQPTATNSAIARWLEDT